MVYHYHPPKCLENHHDDRGNLIVYLGETKPCIGCSSREICFDAFVSWRKHGDACADITTHEPEFCPCRHTTSCDGCMDQVAGFFTTEELVTELMKREDRELALTKFDLHELECECTYRYRGGI